MRIFYILGEYISCFITNYTTLTHTLCTFSHVFLKVSKQFCSQIRKSDIIYSGPGPADFAGSGSGRFTPGASPGPGPASLLRDITITNHIIVNQPVLPVLLGSLHLIGHWC